ncbi:MAG TPA: DPP IV N-terminal domain-containing protein [Vicinamibacterales bacterium]|nr:DPP IV N-terminal domain-containing protein [Vicinamibacterales bacterium]
MSVTQIHVNRPATAARRGTIARLAIALGLAACLPPAAPVAQDRLKTMPGYDRYQKISTQINGAVRSGAINGAWSADSQTVEYVLDGTRYSFDIATRTATVLGDAANVPAAGRGGRGGRGGAAGVERGRQAASAEAPDGTRRAFYRDRNLWISDAAGGNESPITADGSEKDRIKYASASWVYGEELGQTTAMWWSPSSTKIAYYRFDEKQVLDYNLQLNQTQIQSTNDVEAYPKAGASNPIVDLFVYDVATKKTTRIDVRDGKPFDNAVVGHYVYRVSWTPDSRELLFTRTNRRQNVLEFVAANPETGATRVIVREEWPTGWIDNRPTMHFLGDHKRFIWESERNGFANLYLYDLGGTLLNPITSHATFEVAGVIKVDEAAGVVFYTARDGDNHLKLQLHRVGLDGKGDVRLTDPAFNHTIAGCLAPAAGGGRGGFGAPSACGISPDNKYIIDTYQTHDVPPSTRILDGTGAVVADVAKGDLTKFTQLALKKAEMFTYTAADGKTTLHGLIQFPSNFDPARKYPVLVPVYGGPASASNTARETFVTPSALTEYGFLIVNLDSRAAPGMGKRMLDSIYLKLGQVEIDDIAEGVKALAARPYVDKARVGIYGTSYGGYSSVMSILRHPDVYAAASASSPVTAWDHYDSIYTERYMWIPQENKTGYEMGSAMKYASALKGRLMLYYGTADNNVHPSNMMQLIDALQRAGKSFEVQVGPDRGHSGINTDRMMEFFIENLIMRPAAAMSVQ